MDDAFEKLCNCNNNTVDNLIRWLKDCNIIEDSEEAEAKARKLFKDVEDATNVQLDKFKQAVTKLADEQERNLEEFFQMLAAQGPRIMDAAMAGAAAFAETLSKHNNK